jgi:hypothetical protein
MAVCLRPRFPLLHSFPVTHVVYVFPGFLHSPAPAFLGPQQTFLVVICRSALPRDAQCSFDPKIVGGVFILGYWKFGLFVPCFCIVVQYYFFYFLASYGPKGISGDRRHCTVVVCAVCIVPMVSHCFMSRRVSDGKNYVIQVYACLCW